MDRDNILKKFSPDTDNLIGILHELQDTNGNNFLSSEDMKEAARFLNITFSHVYGVATYYSMFSVEPRGKYIIRVCNSPVCNMCGSEKLLEQLQQILDVAPGGTTKNMLFTLETTECLGQCAKASGIMINKNFYGSVDRPGLETILKRYK